MAKNSIDEGAKETDALLSDLEKKIKKEYEQAAKETEKKLEKYLEKLEVKNEKKLKDLSDGKITQKEYDDWYTGQIMIGKRWDDMERTLATDLANTSEIARSMTEGYMPEVYALNHNYGTFEMEKGSKVNTSYTLYDRQAVENLIKNEPDTLPQMSDATAQKIREGKLIKWNEQKIRSTVTQGILQGESIPKIAKRMRDVADMDYKASIRNARTATTYAQSKGRTDAYKRAKKMGINAKRQWIAVHDGRTRHEHAALDGQVVDVDKPFEVAGYEIMEPGDPGAAPEMVYNCRCRVIGVVDDEGKNIKDFHDEDWTIEGKTYDEWKSDHEKAAEENRIKREEKKKDKEKQGSVVNGKDISETWKMRPDKFNFAIDDVVNAQGFDGLPKVVSAEEFDKYVKESNIVAVRGYSAPDKETLDYYREQLYYGKWYVDCSKGGCAYGRGMYTAYNVGTELKEQTKGFAELYSGKKNGYLETMTLDPSAKIISYADATKLANKYQDDWGIFGEKRAEFEKSYIKSEIEKLNFNEIEKDYIYDRYFSGLGLSSGNHDTVGWYQSLDKKSLNDLEYKVIENVKPISNNLETIVGNMRNIDPGTAAALHGYDAVQAGDKYGELVILNRTKTVIMGGN